jgi:hypothetical protein
MDYESTPDREYFDLRKKAPFVGWPGIISTIEILAVPEECAEEGTITEGTPHWVEMNDLIGDDVLL